MPGRRNSWRAGPPERPRASFINGHDISIDTSIGYAEAAAVRADLDCLITRAGEALCGIKSKGGGIARFEPPVVEPDLRLSA